MQFVCLWLFVYAMASSLICLVRMAYEFVKHLALTNHNAIIIKYKQPNNDNQHNTAHVGNRLSIIAVHVACCSFRTLVNIPKSLFIHSKVQSNIYEGILFKLLLVRRVYTIHNEYSNKNRISHVFCT